MLLFSRLIFVTLISCSCSKTITPMKSEEYVSEGGNITIGCKYEGYGDYDVNNLQWYYQYPASKPEFLLLILHSSRQIEPKNHRLNTRLNNEKPQIFLDIPAATVSDSAIYYCALQPTVRGNMETQYKNYKNHFNLKMPVFHIAGQTAGQHITSLASEEISKEGDPIRFTCNYSGTYSSDSLLWYRQYPRAKPEFLYLLTEGNHKQEANPPVHGLSVKLNSEKDQVFLEISSAEVSSSAVYYCALQPTVTGNTAWPDKYSTGDTRHVQNKNKSTEMALCV
ncbi:uncharacterized protein LOC121722098 [Alosa sapidissima]|uniref:uncharacterized protein LOC121722098 n=1 Tax=Alosa sapidissima TaxID=34773 RepID=UPI001C096138|nr:uncharacterized protein LOC121722098 [Alosa sapidissima]